MRYWIEVTPNPEGSDCKYTATYGTGERVGGWQSFERIQGDTQEEVFQAAAGTIAMSISDSEATERMRQEDEAAACRAAWRTVAG